MAGEAPSVGGGGGGGGRSALGGTSALEVGARLGLGGWLAWGCSVEMGGV